MVKHTSLPKGPKGFFWPAGIFAHQLDKISTEIYEWLYWIQEVFRSKKRNTLQTRYLDLYENFWDHGDNIH